MPAAAPLSFTRSSYRGETVYYRTRHIIVKVNSVDESESAVLSVLNAVMGGVAFEIAARLIGRWTYLQLDVNTNVIALVKTLNNDPRVEYAEPDLRLTGSEGTAKSGDPMLYEGHKYWQWGIDDLNLATVWEYQPGDDSALIGLIDSGVPLTPESYGHISQHDRLTEFMNHEDLDGSRFIAGTNYLSPPPPDDHDETTEPVATEILGAWVNDDHGLSHGTTMAGVIAAKENNMDGDDEFIGTAGVNWGSPVYVSVALDPGSASTIGLVFEAVDEILSYAAANDDPNVVLNLSINYTDGDVADDDMFKSMQDMFDKIVAADAIICISVGNGTPVDGVLIMQPARLGVESASYAPNVLVVGAVDQAGSIWYASGRGVEDMVFAPGVNVGTTNKDGGYSLEFGSSVANAHVSGLAALLWCENSDLAAADIVKCIKKSCRLSTDMPTSDDAETDEIGYRIVDAAAAYQRIKGFAELLTPSITFEDTEPGTERVQEIKIEVTTCLETTFSVTVSGHAFGISPGTYAHDPCSEDPFTLLATYAVIDSDVETGTVTIIWDQQPEYTWDVDISALRSASIISICLVLDKSGSMGTSSGIGSYSRLDVLKYSAGILVDHLDPGHGIGAVSFDTDAAELVAHTLIQPEAPDTSRAAVKAAVETLTTGTQTSIAAGILAARGHLDALPVENQKAIVVLTDGKETHEPLLADLLTEPNDYPVYAIGMGTASSLQADDLIAVTAASDGYCVLTGDLGDTTENRVAEFLSQIQTEICGGSCAFDPTQYLRPGATHRFPIRLSAVDREAEVILIRPPGAPLAYRIFHPSGHPLTRDRIDVTETERLIRLGVPNPANGIWHIEVSLPRADFTSWVDTLPDNRMDPKRLDSHGISYTFRVHTRSSVALKCRISQSDFRPGSTLTALVSVTERGRALRVRPTINAQMIDPWENEQTVRFAHLHGGMFEAAIGARIPGIYRWKITADGRTEDGHAFRRECKLTGAVWIPGG